MRLHPKSIDLVLDRVWRLLSHVGDPQTKLPPVVHVAGTNGKGSTIAMMRAMLEAAGYRVHVYTSPHLVRFAERIRLAGELIPEQMLTDLLEECEQANGPDPITYFEITTVAAYLAFSRTPADILLLETGLGGRLDATNVIDRPALTVITPVSIDHVQFLGETLEAIAGEKAGIIKPGVACISGPQKPEALAVLQQRADDASAPLFAAGRDWLVTQTDKGFSLRGTSRQTRDYPRPSLPGDHQVINAATAVVALENLPGFTVPLDARHAGLQAVDWPARMQRLTRGELVDLLSPGTELWLDGGHNAGAGEMLAAVLSQWDDRPVHLVCGMINTKASDDFLKPLASHVTSLQAVTIPEEINSRTAEETAATAAAVGIAASQAGDVAAAIRAITAAEPKPCRILICGSLYLAGTVLSGNS